MRCESSPRYLDATAVALQWLLCTPPIVMTQSALWSIASARRNSSLRTLLPESCMPVRSSRLMYTSQPLGTPGRCQRWIGVGVLARLYRRVGAPGKSAHAGGDHGLTVIIPPAMVDACVRSERSDELRKTNIAFYPREWRPEPMAQALVVLLWMHLLRCPLLI